MKVLRLFMIYGEGEIVGAFIEYDDFSNDICWDLRELVGKFVGTDKCLFVTSKIDYDNEKVLYSEDFNDPSKTIYAADILENGDCVFNDSNLMYIKNDILYDFDNQIKYNLKKFLDKLSKDDLSDISNYIEKNQRVISNIEDMVCFSEKLGWNVNLDDSCCEFSIFSPCGQDFSFEIEMAPIEEMVSEIKEYYDYFDVSYETYLWLDNSGHGKNGAPDDMLDVYNDMKWVKDKVLELYDKLHKTISK